MLSSESPGCRYKNKLTGGGGIGSPFFEDGNDVLFRDRVPLQSCWVVVSPNIWRGVHKKNIRGTGSGGLEAEVELKENIQKLLLHSVFSL